MTSRDRKTRYYILFAAVASFLVTTVCPTQIIEGMESIVRPRVLLIQTVPKSRAPALQVRAMDLQQNAFADQFSRPVRLHTQELTEDETRQMEKAYNLKTEQSFDPDQIEEVQVVSEGTSASAGGETVNVITKSPGSQSMPPVPLPPTVQVAPPSDGKDVPKYNIASPPPGDQLSGYPVVSYPDAAIRHHSSGFIFTLSAHLKKEYSNGQRVWNAYRENPPSRIYVYRMQTVPDLTSIQDLAITENNIQRPGFELFPRVNGMTWVATKNGISQFGGLYFQEDNLSRKIQEEDVTPNDPYYMKEGGGESSGSSKFGVGIGGLFKIGKAAVGIGTGSVGVGAGSVGVGVSKGSVGVDAGPFGITAGGDATDQWGLRAVGFKPLDDPVSAWRVADGREKNVIVAVIDSGLDMAHPDGPQYVWANPGEIPDNGIDDDQNGFIDDIHGWNFAYENNDLTDDNGHGTFIAGIIAAKTDNGIGIAGINPGAQIMVLKVVNRDGRCQSLNIFRALRYAVNHGARVINISLGAEGLSRLEQLGVNYAHYRGAVVVVAAGNQAGDITKHGPPGLRKVFSISATKMDGGVKEGSNSGPTVALAAPGENIYSLTSKDGKRDGMITPIAKTDYHQLSGTSFAAPFVAGVASLMLAKNPDLTNVEVENILMATARDIEAKGWDIYTGSGILNARGALDESAGKVFGARITEVLIHREEEDFVSADVYGTVQGDLESYTVEVGRGEEPDEWERVYGPSRETVNDGHICRIGREAMKREGDWVVRIKARDTSGRERLSEMPVFTGVKSSFSPDDL